ncbi:MAG: hypothetical protein QOC93_3004 [Actinomycetota bacterium]|jgi:nucleotide-binding universal stress UspA family protein|nr:UspA protein [Cryptosporangiaceae bacterium]MDQ1677860.1 hypothetical protein [Actinomycetota bacterium]
MTPDRPPFTGVVVGIDGAPDGLYATEWAAREAARRGTPLTVVFVREYYEALLPPEQYDALLGEAERFLTEATEAARAKAPGLDVVAVAVDGAAAEELTDRTAGAALLVVGSRGRGGFARLLLGSVADKVLRAAACPAVVVRAGGDPAGPVAVGVHPDADMDAALGFAFAEAARLDRPVWALHCIVVPVGVLPPFGAPQVLMPGVDEHEAEKRVETVLAAWRDRYPGVPVTTSARVDSPAAMLVDASPRAALMVLGGRARRHALGTLTAQVAHHASCPVALVR